MRAEDLSEPTVRSMVIAMRDGEHDRLTSLFAEDAELTDDGRPRPVRSWTESELVANHGWLDVDRETDGGLYLTGQFHSDQWDMPTFWRFRVADGRIRRLDVGMV